MKGALGEIPFEFCQASTVDAPEKAEVDGVVFALHEEVAIERVVGGGRSVDLSRLIGLGALTAYVVYLSTLL